MRPSYVGQRLPRLAYSHRYRHEKKNHWRVNFGLNNQEILFSQKKKFFLKKFQRTNIFQSKKTTLMAPFACVITQSISFTANHFFSFTLLLLLTRTVTALSCFSVAPKCLRRLFPAASTGIIELHPTGRQISQTHVQNYWRGGSRLIFIRFFFFFHGQ